MYSVRPIPFNNSTVIHRYYHYRVQDGWNELVLVAPWCHAYLCACSIHLFRGRGGGAAAKKEGISTGLRILVSLALPFAEAKPFRWLRFAQ